MKLIVGLGNPGEKYLGIRHNLGFMVVDHLVDRLQGTGDSWENNQKLKSLICNLKPTTYNLIVAKPLTFMNNSGMAIALLTSHFSLLTSDIIVVHDDLDLPLGKIKVRMGGAGAGHHGVESIINTLGTDQFIRVRLGIGNLKSQSGEHKAIHFNAEHFVLEPFIHSERSQVKHMLKQAVKALQIFLEQGLEKAQNQFN